MPDNLASIGLIAEPLFFFTIISLVNQSFQTQAALYAVVIGIAVTAGTVAGVTIFGSGGDSSTTIIIFMEVGLGSIWAVLTGGNINYFLNTPTFFGIPIWPAVYTILSVQYIIGMLFAPRAIN